jgi:muconolactone delta-isomerase
MRFMLLGSWDPAHPAIPRLLASEQQRTAELMQEGFVQQLLLRADGAGGYMVLSADSAAAANEQLSSLPFMKEGIMRAELVTLND